VHHAQTVEDIEDALHHTIKQCFWFIGTKFYGPALRFRKTLVMFPETECCLLTVTDGVLPLVLCLYYVCNF